MQHLPPHADARPALERLQAAGCRGAFVARSGIALNPLAPQPDVCEPTLEAIAETIIRVDG